MTARATGAVSLATLTLAVGCTASSKPHFAAPAGPPVAHVGTVTISRQAFVAAYRDVATPHGSAPPAGAPTKLEETVLQGLVQKTIVWIQARRLGLTDGISLNQVLANQAYSTTVYVRLFDYAARQVPQPNDPKVVRFALMDQDLTGFLTQHQMRVYQRWQGRRNTVASAYFGRLLHRYATRVTYSPGFHPPPPYE